MCGMREREMDEGSNKRKKRMIKSSDQGRSDYNRCKKEGREVIVGVNPNSYPKEKKKELV